MVQNEMPKKVTFPKMDLIMEGVEMEGERYEEWTSPDEKHRITYLVRGGGKEWAGVWIKEVILHSLDPLVGSELMRVQIVKNPDVNKGITKTIFVDSFEYEIRDKKGEGRMANYVYSSDSDGLREEMGKTTIHPATGPLEYTEALQETEVRVLADLPKRIDVDETIRLFWEQLEERHFYMPVLVGVE